MSLRNLGRLGNQISVPIEADEAGMLGRECPQTECEGYFKVKPGTGLTGPDLPCHCPYCGHTASGNHFFTNEQIEYAKSVALRQIADAVHNDLKSFEFEHKAQGPFGIEISMKVVPGAPIPLKRYREKVLETTLICDGCSLEYAIYGVFGYCPDCKTHNSLQQLQTNLKIAQKQLNLAEAQADAALTRHLIEDALENCVSAFDGFGRETCKIRASKSTNPTLASSLSFQNLPRVNEKLIKLFGVDLRKTVTASAWEESHVAFMRRHLIAHKAGVIDQQYLGETGESAAFLGRRVTIRARDVESLIEKVNLLGVALIDSLPRID